MERENGGNIEMSTAMEFSQRLDKEADAERRIGDAILEKIAEVLEWQERNPGESRDIIDEVSREHDLSRRYVQHVLWGLEGAALISVSGGRVSLVQQEHQV